MANKPVHAPIQLLSVVDNELHMNNKPLQDIVTNNCQTPCYIYDTQAIAQRLTALKHVLPKSVRIHYAIKANPHVDIVNFVADHVDGLDVASAGELNVALATNITPEKIGFAGPAKTDNELALAIANSVLLHIESRNELMRVIEICKQQSLTPRIALRVNPDFQMKSSGMKMGGGSQPFGIDVEQIPSVIQLINESSLTLLGFHIFSGSQNLDADAIIQGQNACFKLAYRLAKENHLSIQYLNIGGGFGIPYFPGDKHLEIDAIAANLNTQIKLFKKHMGNVEVVLELGRYIVGEAGIYVCQVIDKKVSRGRTYLVTNGGMHHHLAASGNFGQIIRKNYPLITVKSIESHITETVSVVGPLCTPLDILGDKMTLPKCEIGDLIAVMQSGAYGYTASPQHFLSHPPAQELVV